MAATKIGNFHNSASIGPICLILVLIKMFGGGGSKISFKCFSDKKYHLETQPPIVYAIFKVKAIKFSQRWYNY